MARRKVFQNDQSVYFKYADENNNAVGFINLLDDLPVETYQFLEEHLEELIETKQIRLVVGPYGGGDVDVSIKGFKLKSNTA